MRSEPPHLRRVVDAAKLVDRVARFGVAVEVALVVDVDRNDGAGHHGACVCLFKKVDARQLAVQYSPAGLLG